MKVAMVGEKTSVVGFRPLGIDTFEVPEPGDAQAVWEQLELDEYAVIFITEPVYEVLRGELESLRLLRLPVVTVIPAVTGSRKVAGEELRALVERAVGTDVMFRE
jgi:V/A-type H+-transporting ATPase subunit F